MNVKSLKQKSARTIRVGVMIKCIGIAAVLAVLAFRVYAHYVPLGANPFPFLLASVEGDQLRSPDGTYYRVFFNDAGATRSGNHWTWIIDSDPVFGKRVVVSGYMDYDQVRGKKRIDVSWTPRQKPIVTFLDSR